MSKTMILLAAALLAGLANTAQAIDRRFAFNYETTTQPKGLLEYEQWFTWQHYADGDKYKFRHEFEYGLTDRLQLGLYLFDWEHEREDAASSTKWEGTGVELIYNLSDPTKDFIGSALYGEFVMSDQELELEAKLLLQKNFGPIALVYNAILEAEWEDGYSEDVGVLGSTAGLSYQVTPNFLIGVEATQEIELEGWSHAGDTEVFVGPNLSLRTKGGFWITVAGLFQATNSGEAAESQLRVLAGFNF